MSSHAVETSGDSVKVICRVRPFNDREIHIQDANTPVRSVIEMRGQDTILLDHEHDYQEKERFRFDFSIWSIPEAQQKSSTVVSSQDDVFRVVGEPTLRQCWEGYNSCLFAYGQTGAGKTYTMMGPKPDPGIIPRLCKEMFLSVERQIVKNAEPRVGPLEGDSSEVKEYEVEARFMEIYNEHVKDLLWELNPHTDPAIDKENLKVRNFPGKGPDVVGLTTINVKTWEECMNLIETGIRNRTVASTKMNNESSRSHSIFRLTLTQNTKILPKKQYEKMQTFTRLSSINLVDLAGSERNKKSGVEGQQLKEAAAINKSLTVLKQVIDALVERKAVVPYRESQLTWLLSESLGGNSKTFMMACVSPHYDNSEETLNTLRYALRTQGIMNCAQVNDTDDLKKMEKLKGELSKLQEDLDRGGSNDLHAELQATQDAMAELHAKLHDVEQQAKELQRAYEQEKELKYARALQAGIRVFRERRLMTNAKDQQLKLQAELRGKTKELDILSLSTTQSETTVQNLAEEENEVVQSYKEQQAQLNFWKDSHSELVSLEQELREQQQKKREEFDKREAEKKLAATIAAMGSEKLRNELQKKVRSQVMDHEQRVQAVLRKASNDYQMYGEESCARQNRVADEIDQLKYNVRHATVQLTAETSSFQQNTLGLEKEIAFQGREIVEQNSSAQNALNKIVTERVNVFETKQAELKAIMTRTNEEYRIKHNLKMNELAEAWDKMQVEGQGDIDDCTRRGEKRLREVNAYWEAKMLALDASKSEELDCAHQLNEETQDFLRTVEFCERMKSLSIAQVEAALQDPRLRADSGADRRSEYQSVSPAVYSLGELVDVTRPSLTAITNALMATPRLMTASRSPSYLSHVSSRNHNAAAAPKTPTTSRRSATEKPPSSPHRQVTVKKETTPFIAPRGRRAASPLPSSTVSKRGPSPLPGGVASPATVMKWKPAIPVRK